MTEVRDDSFTHILVGDVTRAYQRLGDDDTPTHRRELVRAVSAAIEGLIWMLKRYVLYHGKPLLTPHEILALQEESFNVSPKGKVEATPRFLPLTTAIRLVVGVVTRYRPDYKVDFTHRGWPNLQVAVEVRNRLVHPKTMEDLSVSDDELERTLSAFYWMLALAIEVLAETHVHVKGYQFKWPAD